MKFKLWIENLEGEKQALYDEYIRIISYDGLRQINVQYKDHLMKQFAGMEPEQIRAHIEETRPYAEREKRQWLSDQEREKALAAEKDKFPDLNGTYTRTEDTYNRIICSDDDPKFEKHGMPMYGLNDHSDPALKGYHCVHVGSTSWLPILLRDGYCDGEFAYVYEIDTSFAYESKMPFYVMEDFHIMDKTNTPGSDIIFSKRKTIPAKMLKLIKVIDLKDVEPAPDPY